MANQPLRPKSIRDRPAWLVGGTGVAPSAATPRADGEDQARKACRQIAKNRDWKSVDADVRKEKGDRIVVMMSGERKGEDHERECRYDGRRGRSRARRLSTIRTS